MPNAEPRDTHPDPTYELTDSYRLLFVSAPEIWPPQSGPAQRQLDLVNVAGFKSRDMAVVYLGKVDARLIEFDPENRETHFDGMAGDIRAARQIPDGDFTARLVGKDGQEKAAFDAPVTAETLFERVDSMPMRQREMRERGKR